MQVVYRYKNYVKLKRTEKILKAIKNSFRKKAILSLVCWFFLFKLISSSLIKK